MGSPLCGYLDMLHVLLLCHPSQAVTAPQPVFRRHPLCLFPAFHDSTLSSTLTLLFLVATSPESIRSSLRHRRSSVARTLVSHYVHLASPYFNRNVDEINNTCCLGHYMRTPRVRMPWGSKRTYAQIISFQSQIFPLSGSPIISRETS